MNLGLAFVFGLLGMTVVGFVTERLRMDLGALLILLGLTLFGILTPQEALVGFSDPVVLMIAGLFVVSGGLFQTGVAHILGRVLTRFTRQDERSLIVVAMVAAALLSAFMSSAGTTAILIPVVFNMASRIKLSPSRALMPLAFGSLIGGTLTLIGTPPNLVISNELAAHGGRSLGFFAFFPMGLLLLVIGVGFMLFVGRHWLPQGKRGTSFSYTDPEDLVSLTELSKDYGLPENLFHLRVRSTSSLAGMSLVDADLGARYHVTILEIQPWPDMQKSPEPAYPAEPETVLAVNDVLHVQGTPRNIARLAQQTDLGILPSKGRDHPVISQEVGMVELLLPPRSQLIGQTLQEARFRDKYNVTVLSLRRLGEPLKENVASTRLRFGDTLLVLGTWERIQLLQDEHRNFVVVGVPREMLDLRRSTKRALLAASIMLIMLILMAFDVVPGVMAVLGAAVAMVLTDCLTMEQAYAAMNWQSVVLLAGMIPLATALQKTGGVQLIADVLNTSLGGMGPLAVMGGLFLITAFLSQFISNTVTAVLMAPVAIQAATTLNITPQAFLMAVAFAASTAFASPVATLSSTMVMAPGGYHFEDYLKVGLVLEVLVMIGALVVLPLLFPF